MIRSEMFTPNANKPFKMHYGICAGYVCQYQLGQSDPGQVLLRLFGSKLAWFTLRPSYSNINTMLISSY